MAQVKMTKEMKAKLAGLLPMDNTTSYSWTPDVYLTKTVDEEGKETYDIDEAFHPVFEIRQFSQEQVLDIKVSISKELNSKSKVVNQTKMAAQNKEYMDMLHTVLVGWTNLYDLGTGDLFEYDGSLDTMMKLPESIRTDLFAEAMRITGFIPQG